MTTEAVATHPELNATKHGLRAAPLRVLPDESAEELAALLDRLREEWKPVGMVEEALVERIGDALWRLRRASRAEAAVLEAAYFEENKDRAENFPWTWPYQINPDKGKRKVYVRARRLYLEAVQGKNRVPAIAGSIRRVAESNLLEKLTKYTVAAERSLTRCLKELRDIQAERKAAESLTKAV